MTASELRKDLNEIADRAEAIEKVAEDIETRLAGVEGTESQNLLSADEYRHETIAGSRTWTNCRDSGTICPCR